MVSFNGDMLYTLYSFDDERVQHIDGNIYWTLSGSILYTHKYELYNVHDITNPPKNLININYFLRYHSKSNKLYYIVPFTINDYNMKSDYIKYMININNFTLPNFNIKSYYIDYNKYNNDIQYHKNIIKYQNQIAFKNLFGPTINDFLLHVEQKESLVDTDNFLSSVW